MNAKKARIIRIALSTAVIAVTAYLCPSLIPAAVKLWGAQGGLTMAVVALAGAFGACYGAPGLIERTQEKIAEKKAAITSFLGTCSDGLKKCLGVFKRHKVFTAIGTAAVTAFSFEGLLGLGAVLLATPAVAGVYRGIRNYMRGHSAKLAIEQALNNPPEYYQRCQPSFAVNQSFCFNGHSVTGSNGASLKSTNTRDKNFTP